MIKNLLTALFLCSLGIILNAQIVPGSLPGLELWVTADEGTQTSNGVVFQWDDQSGNGNHLVQSAGVRRPIIAENALNNHAVVNFDGADDYMDFPELNNIRTVFWVIEEDEDAPLSFKFMLGHHSSYHFHRGQDGHFWNEQYSSDAILNGETRVLGEPVDVTTSAIPSGFKVVSLRTSGPVEASRFSRDRTYSTTVWDGSLAQLLIFSDSLNQDEVEGVEEYLFQYYTSPLDLGDDILISDNLCDTTLVATSGYVSYSWSNGSINDSLIVNESGIYWVDATDVFGRVVRDSIQVTYPGNFSPPGNFICAGESLTWDTGLDNETYDFLWQDNSTEPAFTATEETLLSLTVTDLQGCSYSPNPVLISVDDFAEQVSLGSDAAFCIGELISVEGTDIPGLSFLWSDGTEAPQFEYAGQSEISVEVTNSNACTAMDMISATSLGDAPDVSFSAQNTCFGDLTLLTDESTSLLELVSWQWFLGDVELAEQAQFDYTFEAPGPYEIHLEVIDENGCRGETTQELLIHQLPQADFASGLACENQEVQFYDESTIGDAEINSWLWQYNGEEEVEQEPLLQFSESGFQNVSLTVSDELGCSSNYSMLIDVRATPDLSFQWDGQCQGEFTQFNSSYVENGAGIPVDYDWRFGDATSSSQENPNHFYALEGSYEVSLEVTAINGCSNIAQEEINIYDPPIAYIAELNLCAGTEELLQDESMEQTGDPIVDWAWEVAGLGALTGEEPTIQIEGPGAYGVSLTVITEHDCIASYGNELTVHELPEFEVDFSPEIGAAPLEVDAQAYAIEEYSYSWYSEGVLLGTGSELSFSFEENRLETIQVTAVSEFGCLSDAFIQIPVEEAITDLILAQLEDSDGLHVWVMNNGNYSINELEFRQAYVGANAAIEYVQTTLAPGELFEYDLIAQVESDLRGTDVKCVRVRAVDALSEESSPENNEQCLDPENTEAELYPPFPNPVNDEVQLHFYLPSNETARLSLWNTAGQKVWSTNELDLNAGYNRVQANLIGLGTGTYLIRLEYRDKEYVDYLMKW